MSGARNHGWLRLVSDCWQLGAEASLVVPLRLARLATGGKLACDEAQLMVSEKVKAHRELIADVATGRMGSDPRAIASESVKHYLRYVRANRIRLSRGG